MKKLILISTILLLLLILPSVKAELPNNTFEPDNTVNYFVYCVHLNNSICNNRTNCELTTFNPDTSVLVQNVSMSYNGSGFFNYSFGVLETEGRYSTLIYCSNTEQGVVSSFFIVGLEEQIYDNIFWLYIFLLLIPMILCIIAWKTEDKFFNIMAGMVLGCAALFMYSYGFPQLNNTFIEDAMVVIVSAIGLYLIGKNSYDLVVGDF